MGCQKLIYKLELRIYSSKKSRGINGMYIYNYRYSFNGKENTEIANEGDYVDFGARIYDCRLGRWMSLDPKWQVFPSYSNYVYAVNNPIRIIDADGKIIQPYDEYSRQTLVNHFDNLFGCINGGAMATLLSNHLSMDGQLNQISPKEFKKALKGLSHEQKVLARGYYASINTSNKTVYANLKSNDCLPMDIVKDKQNTDDLKRYKNVDELLDETGGGATYIDENRTISLVIVSDEWSAKKGSMVNEDRDAEKPTGPICDFDETTVHEMIGHAVLEQVFKRGKSDLGGIQISNTYRKLREYSEDKMRNGWDHNLTITDPKVLQHPPSELETTPTFNNIGQKED